MQHSYLEVSRHEWVEVSVGYLRHVDQGLAPHLEGHACLPEHRPRRASSPHSCAARGIKWDYIQKYFAYLDRCEH